MPMLFFSESGVCKLATANKAFGPSGDYHQSIWTIGGLLPVYLDHRGTITRVFVHISWEYYQSIRAHIGGLLQEYSCTQIILSGTDQDTRPII